MSLRGARHASPRRWPAALTAWLAAVPAAAHHGTSAYDMSDARRLDGRVVEWLWTSPHTWLEFDATAPDGTTTRWRIEGGPPRPMRAQGWSETTLVPGQRVEIVISPARDEPGAGILRQLHKPGGESLLIRRPGYTG